MLKVPETIPVSQLRDDLGNVMERVGAEPMVLTHRGKAKFVIVSVDAWNSMSVLMKKYADLELIEKTNQAMEGGDFFTVEEAEAEFKKAGLM